MLYRALLRLYPKSFRAEYGAEMIKDFARGWPDASSATRVMRLAHAVIDVGVNALGVHLDILKQDVRYASRSLRRTPGFTATAIAVAALGIGATTATFSTADHVLLRPLPFADPDTLVKLTEDHTTLGYPRMEPSPANYRDWKRLATSFESIEAYNGDTASLVGSGEPERVAGSQVAGGVFRLLGREAAIGRTLTESDVANDTNNAVVISDRLWRTKFASDPNVLGRTLSLDQASLTIVGVMPPDFHFPARGTDFWRALRFSNSASDQQPRQSLSPGDGAAQARCQLRTGAIGTADHWRSDRAAVSQGADRQEHQPAAMA